MPDRIRARPLAFELDNLDRAVSRLGSRSNVHKLQSLAIRLLQRRLRALRTYHISILQRKSLEQVRLYLTQAQLPD